MHENLETIQDLEVIAAPWGKEITLRDVAYESGLNLLRMRIKENKRFTDLDLDPDTAESLAVTLGEWAKAAREKMGE